MTKIVVQKPFKFKNEVREKGTELDMPDSVAEDAIDKGYVKPADEVEEEKEGKEKIPEVGAEKDEKEVSADEDSWEKLESVRKESGSLPPKWNPSQGNPSPPEPNPLMGVVVRKGQGPNGPFIVVEERGSERKHTVWQHTALKTLIHSVNPRDKVSIKFEGEDTNPTGQTYLNYTVGALKPDNSRRILENPKEEEED